MRSLKAVLLVAVAIAATSAAIRVNGQAGTSGQGGSSAATAVVTGTVTAAKPFKAAHQRQQQRFLLS